MHRSVCDTDVLMAKVGSRHLYMYYECIRNPGVSVYDTSFDVPLPTGLSEEKVLDSVRALIYAHPVLRSRVVSIDGELYFVTDNDVDIRVGDTGSYNDYFDPHKELSRIRISEGYDRLYIGCHHLINDFESIKILSNDILRLVHGVTVRRETGFFKLLAEDQMKKNIESMLGALVLFDRMLGNKDNRSGLVEDAVPHQECSILQASTVPRSVIEGFVSMHGMTMASFFAAVFGYTLCRYNRRDHVMFLITDNGRDDIISNDSVGSFLRGSAIGIDLIAGDTGSSLKSISESYYGALQQIRAIDAMEALKRYSDEIVHTLYQYFRQDVMEHPKERKVTILDDKNRIFCEVALYAHDDGKDITFEFTKSHRYPQRISIEIMDMFNDTLEHLVANGTIDGLITSKQDKPDPSDGTMDDGST